MCSSSGSALRFDSRLGCWLPDRAPGEGHNGKLQRLALANRLVASDRRRHRGSLTDQGTQKMRWLVSLGLLAAWMATASPAAAGDWRWVSSSDTDTVGIDFASVRIGPALYGRPSTTKLVWTVWVPKRDLPRGTRDWDYRVQRLTIDCSAETISSGNTIYYALTSTSPTDSSTGTSTASPIVPDTLGSALADAACGEAPAGEGLSTAGDFAALQLMSDAELEELVRGTVEDESDIAAAAAADAAAAAATASEGAPSYQRAPACRIAAVVCDPWDRLWSAAHPLPPGATVTGDGWIIPAKAE